MWTLPLAIGFSWQAITQRRHLAAAIVFTALTIAFHYETGYLVTGAVLVLGLVGHWDGTLRHRVARVTILAVLAAGAPCGFWCRSFPAAGSQRETSFCKGRWMQIRLAPVGS